MSRFMLNTILRHECLFQDKKNWSASIVLLLRDYLRDCTAYHFNFWTGVSSLRMGAASCKCVIANVLTTGISPIKKQYLVIKQIVNSSVEGTGRDL